MTQRAAVTLTPSQLAFLDHLKAATRSEHRAIEDTLDLVSPALTQAEYRQRIARFHGFYLPLEAALFSAPQWPAQPLEAAPRRKLPWLRADLRALGVDDRLLPRCEAMPQLGTRAQRFGCLYVLEGSTLGGQVICRHLRTTLAVTPEQGGSFFFGYGERTGAMWTAFRAALAAFAATPAAQHGVVDGAVATFRAMRLWCGAAGPA